MTTTTTPDQTQVTNLPPTQTVSGTVNVGNLPPTQPISAASLPLPTGAATEASLGTDGATPPSIPGTGIRGWLRSIYDKLSGTLTTDVSDRSTRALGHVVLDSGSVVATGPLTDAQLRASAPAVDVTPAAPAANDYLPVRLTDGAAFYSATGGTGGGGGAVTVADGADVAQGVTTDAAWASGAGTTIGLLKAVVNAIKGTLTVATHAVTQSGSWTQDVTDRAARLLGHVTVDNGSLPVTGTFWQTTQPVSGTVGVSNAFALDATVGTTNTEVGGLTETAPATDTASSGLNGRLQRIAQRLTALIAQVPATLGQKTMANSLAVTVASDQSAVPVSGTFWQATQPVSGTVTANQGTANATPWNEQMYCGDATGTPSPVGYGAGQQVLPVKLNNIAFTAASTAPTAAQQTLVASLSPNIAAAGNVKQLKDANRTAVLLFASAVASVTSEAMVTLTISSAAGAPTTGTSYTVPAGKTLRVQSVHVGTNFATMSATVTFANVSTRIRAGSAITSNLMYQTRLDAASNFPGATEEIDLPDGWELPAGTVIGVSQLGSATTLVTDIALIGYLY